MYVFKGLGLTPSNTVSLTPIVNNPTVPTAPQQQTPTAYDAPAPTMIPPPPPGYVMIFGRMFSYTQIGLALAAVVAGFFLWKHYKSPKKTA